MPNQHFILSENQRKKYLDFFDLSSKLQEEKVTKRSLINHIMIHIFLAEEFVGLQYRKIFLDNFWKMIDSGSYDQVDWDYVKSQQTNGVFLSEIVTYEYTIPYLYAIAVLIALRELTPNRSLKEIDQEITRLATIFRGLSWGHGIERPVEARRIVNWLAAAGAFPRNNAEKGYLEVIEPIYQKLIELSQKPNGFGQRKEPIFHMEILLNLIKEKDIPSEKYPKEFLEKTRERTPAFFWIIERKINCNELLLAFNNRRLSFDPLSFPWHAITFHPNSRHLSKLQKLASKLAIQGFNHHHLASLLKLDSILRKEQE